MDADQYYLGKHMLTSATKRVDTAVFDMIKRFQANPSGFRGGFNTAGAAVQAPPPAAISATSISVECPMD